MSLEFPSRYDFALSFAGSDRNIAEALFNSLHENELEVFYDRNEQYRILGADVEEYLAPIYSSDAQLVVCILGKDYPNRVWTKVESDHFKHRFRNGEVVPIVFKDTPLGIFDSATKTGHILWDRDGDFEDQVRSATDLLIRKSVDIRTRRAREAEQLIAVDGASPRN